MSSIDVEEANAMIAADERRITSRYASNVASFALNVAIMLVVAYYADVKWVTATGFGLLIATIGAQDARGFDIAVRINRTNHLLRDLMIVIGKRS
jgi:hypothetical protein